MKLSLVGALQLFDVAGRFIYGTRGGEIGKDLGEIQIVVRGSLEKRGRRQAVVEEEDGLERGGGLEEESG